jgi:hypothetical protein
MLVDDFLPTYDVSDGVAAIVQADLATTWNALMEVDLLEVGRKKPMVAILGAMRGLPDIASHLLHGKAPAPMPKRMRLLDTTANAVESGGWVLLGLRPNDELALGLVGKFWKPVIPFVAVPASEFRAFEEPGFAKTIYSLSVRALDDRRTLVSAVMRTATTDDDARTWFRRYWTLGVGSGAHVLVNGVLELVRDAAEAKMKAAVAP